MSHKYLVRTFNCKCKNPSEYDVCEPYAITLKPGKYQFDCFGGSSAYSDSASLNGYGAHVSGIISLFSPKIFYIYVGGQGSTYFFNQKGKLSPGGYNGGGNGGYGAYNGNNYRQSGCGGGGATDIRTIGGKWNDPSSLASRLIVAGAAGGWNVHGIKGGNGGALNGQEAYDYGKRRFEGGSQNSGYKLGEGQSGASKDEHVSYGSEGNSGAGSGYYGGFASQYTDTSSSSAGSGGSSFISGYKNLPVIDNIVFLQPKMIDGDVAKHFGDGIVNITYIESFSQHKKVILRCYWVIFFIFVTVRC